MSNSGFKEGPEENSVDVLDKFVTKSYLMDVYPFLTGLPNLITSGLWTWGYNYYGSLGDGYTENKSSPVQTIARGNSWKNLNTGLSNQAAIKTDGTLWTWGANDFGGLGDNTIVNKSSPIQTVSGGTSWKMVSCGVFHTSAIKTDGTLWTWGYNTLGQLGDNSSTNKSSPVQTVSGGTNWKMVSCGSYFTSAIKTDGTLWTWGYNTFGELGTNNTTGRSSPVQTVSGGNNWKMVSCGITHSAAIKTDGTLWLWGSDTYGELGDDSYEFKSSPVQTIVGGTSWKLVSCGYGHTGAIKTDGTLWIWGYNNYGELGNDSYEFKSSPIQTVSGGNNWKLVSCGYQHTGAIKTDGTLWTWGRNAVGQLGDNTNVPKSSPIQTIAGGTNWKSVTCGYDFSIAIREMGDDF